MRDRPPVIEAICSRLPSLRILTDRSAMEGFRRDETEFIEAGWPLAVVFPETTDDVAAIVGIAASHGIAIVPRGAGTGMSGGAVAIDGALTMVMTRMNRIVEVDRANRVAIVQPGVLNADLGREVARHGLFYAPDPASFETCTIGGNIAENSGGLRCIKYGVTRDAVLSLEVVLADGSTIRTGGRTVKDVAGYDLTHLFIGSEGTLGIVTEAIVRLRPMPAPTLTLLAFFDDERAAGNAVSLMIGSNLAPSTLEYMDRYTISAVETQLRLGLPTGAAAMLMVESDAGPPVAEQELQRAEAICLSAGASEIARAADAQEADWLRQARRKAHWALEQVGIARMDDVGVPLSCVSELLAAITRISREENIPVGVFGHAGDGNFHPTYVVDRADPSARQRIESARSRIYETVIGLGGTVTGEHGTGLVKKAYLERQRGRIAVDVMRAVKHALDPQAILNPGKVVDVGSIQDQPRRPDPGAAFTPRAERSSLA